RPFAVIGEAIGEEGFDGAVMKPGQRGDQDPALAARGGLAPFLEGEDARLEQVRGAAGDGVTALGADSRIRADLARGRDELRSDRRLAGRVDRLQVAGIELVER